MTRSNLRRSGAAAVAVLALASLTACGSDDERSGATSSTSDAASDGAASDGGNPAASGSAAPADDAGEEIDGGEFIDLYLAAMDRATTATLAMSVGGTASVEGTGAADFTTTPPSMRLTITDPITGQDQRMIIVDGVMYLGLQPEKYLAYDLSDPESPLGTNLTDQLDPGAMADVFEKGITRAAYLGQEDVEGEPMEHYRVLLDSATLLGQAGLPEAGLPEGAGAAVPDEVAFDLWFDDEGNFRRQQATLGKLGAGVELSYDNWGEPVDIEKPPASQITKAPTG
jgi:hypothetical protein